jgi:hypothetical protein
VCVMWFVRVVHVICKSRTYNWYLMFFRLSVHEVIYQSLFVLLFSFSSTWDG